jgi:hypothetical protein
LLDAQPQAVVHMPQASAWPFWLSCSLLVLFYGFLLESWFVTSIGGILAAGCLMGWFWPRDETQET